MSRRARVDYVDELEGRITLCENDRAELRKSVAELERKNDELVKDNYRLMRRVLVLENHERGQT